MHPILPTQASNNHQIDQDMSDSARRILLLVDDTPENLTILSELLQPDYCVLAAISGESGLRIAAGRGKYFDPDMADAFVAIAHATRTETERRRP
jgi:response regulator RpfG family c-di-GMP phosphodiesterase